MVVTELDLQRVTVLEAKADAPLIVDRDGMLTGATALQRMQTIAGRHAKITELGGDMYCFQLAQGTPRDVCRHPLSSPRAKELLGRAVGERLDHTIV